MSGIDYDEFGEIGVFGQPYHGLWKAGEIALPNGGKKACPAPVSGGCVLLRVPNPPPVSRTGAQAAADLAAGREWRDYALISGGRYGPTPAIHTNYSDGHVCTVVLIDETTKRWLVRIAKNSAVAGQFFLSLRRYLHVDGQQVDWSAPVAIDLPVEYWNAVSIVAVAMTIAQNSTGRESVLGAVPESGGDSAALLHLTIAGTVDIAASGYGLSIAGALLEWPDRPSGAYDASRTVSGVWRQTTTYHYYEYDQTVGQPTGGVYDRVVVEEGVLATLSVVSDDGEPPTAGPGRSWNISHQETECTTDKQFLATFSNEIRRYYWAGYKNDVLYLAERGARHITAQSGTGRFGEPGGMTWDVIDENWQEEFSRFGEIVLHQSSTTPTSSPSAGVYDGNLAPFGEHHLNRSSQINDDPLIERTMIADNHWKERGTYAKPVPGYGARFANPCVMLITRVREYGAVNATVDTLHSIHAPGGAMLQSDLNVSTLHCSWHPETDQIMADAELVCWF